MVVLFVSVCTLLALVGAPAAVSAYGGGPGKLTVHVQDELGRPIEGVRVRVVKTNDNSLVRDMYTDTRGRSLPEPYEVRGVSKVIDVEINGLRAEFDAATWSCPGDPRQGQNYDAAYFCGLRKRDYHNLTVEVTLQSHTGTETVCRLTGRYDDIDYPPFTYGGNPPQRVQIRGQDTPFVVPTVDNGVRRVLWWFGDSDLRLWQGSTLPILPNMLATTLADADPSVCLDVTYDDWASDCCEGLAVDGSLDPAEQTVWLGAPFVKSGDPLRDPSDGAFYPQAGDTLWIRYASISKSCTDGKTLCTDDTDCPNGCTCEGGLTGNRSRAFGIARYDNNYPGYDGSGRRRLTREPIIWGRFEQRRVPSGASVLAADGTYTIFGVQGGTFCANSPHSRCLSDMDCLAQAGSCIGTLGVVATRVHRDNVLDKSAYTYWEATTSEFLPDRDPDALFISSELGNSVDVMWSTYLNRWIMITNHPFNKMVMRSAPELTGPWDGPAVTIMENINNVWTYNPRFIPSYTSAPPNDAKIYWAGTYQARYHAPGHPTANVWSGKNGYMNYNVFLFETDLSKVHVDCGDAVVDPGEDCDLGVNNGVPGYGCSEWCGFLGTCVFFNDPCVTHLSCPVGVQCNCAPATPCTE